MDGEVGGGAVVQREGVHRHSDDIALGHHELGGFGVKAGEVHGSVVVGVSEFFGVDEFRPAGKHCDDGALRDFAVCGLPLLEVVGGELGVGVGLGFFADVDDGEGGDELLRGDLVGGESVFGEVEGGVHVGSGVLVDEPFLRVVGAAGEDVDGDAGSVVEGGEFGGEGVGEVHDAASAVRVLRERGGGEGGEGGNGGDGRKRGGFEESPSRRLIAHSAGDGGKAVWQAHDGVLEILSSGFTGGLYANEGVVAKISANPRKTFSHPQAPCL